MKSDASEPSRSASTAVAKLNFLGGQSGPALFSNESILKPLPKRNQNFFGWLDPTTQLCFAIFPAYQADDGFDGMHFQIYVEGIEKRQRVAFIKLEAVEKTGGGSATLRPSSISSSKSASEARAASYR